MKNKTGHFIIFEGSDYSGKSTCIKKIKTIREKDNNFYFTREPGSMLKESKEECESIRKNILSNRHNNEELIQLYYESRLIHTKNIINVLKKGYNVICDRYVISSLAYQGYTNNMMKKVVDINKPILNLLEKNNIKMNILLFNISESTYLERKQKRMLTQDLDEIEKNDELFFSKIREFYNNKIIYNEYTSNLFMNSFNIDANRDISVIVKECNNIIDKIIK